MTGFGEIKPHGLVSVSVALGANPALMQRFIRTDGGDVGIQMTRRLALVSVFLVTSVLPIAGIARAADFPFVAGDTFTVSLQVETQSSSGGGSSGSSHDVWALTERVVALRDAGVELEFDLTADVSADDRRIGWQFPARIFQPTHGPAELLNWNEAEPRLRAWLGEQYPAICGHWFFTWTAQKIDCDAQSVIQSLAPYVQPSGLAAGQLYSEPGASGSVPLEADAAGHALIARMNVDPEVVRWQRAGRDVAVAEITHRTVAFDDALRARSSDRISGTVTVTFELDGQGRITRRRRVAAVEVASSDGSIEREQTTETTEWAPASHASHG